MTTWRGLLREIERAAKREARQRAYEEKQRAKAEAAKEAKRILNQYHDLILGITTLHKKCPVSIDWESISKSDPPEGVSRDNNFERIAKEKKQQYQPSAITKFLNRTEKELSKLDEEISEGREKDSKIYESQIVKYHEEYKKWEIEKDLASKVIKGESEAIQTVLNSKLSLKTNPFIGKKIDINLDYDKLNTSDLIIHQIDEIIPTFNLKQLKSGNLSRRDMPISKRFLLYKEYVCSAVIRLGREFFALFPIEEIVINAKCDQLNGKTGYMENIIILSAFIPKTTLEEINLQMIEPSKAIENFKHNMDFKKSSGFQPVPQISKNTDGNSI